MSIGDDIREYRIEKGWSRNRLAEVSGVSRTSLIRYETDTEPNFFIAECLLNALGYEVLIRNTDGNDERLKELIVELDGMLSDVNVNEIADHLSDESLFNWCGAWREEARRILDELKKCIN